MRKVLFSVLVLVLASGMANADLRAWYAFDEASGDYALDSSSYGNNGVLYPESTWNDPAQPVPGTAAAPQRIAGVNGNALLFNSNSTFGTVRAARSASLQYMSGAFTFAAWVRQDSYAQAAGGGTSWQRLISCPSYEIELGPGDWDNYIWPYYPGGVGGAWDMPVGQTYGQLGGSTGDWYHMALSYDGHNVRYYINGELKNTIAMENVPMPEDNWGTEGWADSPFTIGGQTWPSQGFFIGALDDVSIWGHAYLDGDQIASLIDFSTTPGTVGFHEIPEPITMILFGIGGLLLRRK
jgi:hypothetical protein